MITEMASEDLLPFVVGEGDLTVGAVDYMSTRGAGCGCVVAATVEKKESLFS